MIQQRIQIILFVKADNLIFGETCTYSTVSQMHGIEFPEQFEILLYFGFCVTDSISENNSCESYAKLQYNVETSELETESLASKLLLFIV